VRKRWIVGGIAAVLLGISGTGLALNSGWLGGRWDASHAATGLATELQKLSSVQSAEADYSPLGLPNPTMKVAVTFNANATPAQWGTASAIVRSAASTKALAATTTTATFREVGETTTANVEPLPFSPALVSFEIAAWRALRASVGDRVSLHLGYPTGTSTSSAGQLVREYTVTSSDDMRKVAALWPGTVPEVDPSLSTSWAGPGIQLHEMPSANEMASLAAVARVLQLASADPKAKQTGTYAAVLGDLRGFKVTILSLKNSRYTKAEPDKKIADATRAALAAGAPTVEWMSSDHDPTLVAGECGSYDIGGKTVATTFQAATDADWFASRLAANGFALPQDVRAGSCQP